MKNIYLYIFSKFFFLSKKLNTDDHSSVVKAVGMISLFPVINFVVILEDLMGVDVIKYLDLIGIITVCIFL